MNLGRKKPPEVKCISLNHSIWQKQIQNFEADLTHNSTTVILSIKDLVANDPIIAMNILQKIKNSVKMNPNYKIAALNRDLLLITPFTLYVAE